LYLFEKQGTSMGAKIIETSQQGPNSKFVGIETIPPPKLTFSVPLATFQLSCLDGTEDKVCDILNEFHLA
jgi:hypothetical protein